MQVPFKDNSIEVMVAAIRHAQSVLHARKYATYTELHRELCFALAKYEHLGGGVEQFRLSLTKNCENESKMENIIEELNRRCDAAARECDTGPMNQVNDLLPFVRSSTRILVHGCGNLTALAVACAVQERRGVHFYVTEGLPTTADCPKGAGHLLVERARATPQGFELKEQLLAACTIIPDSAAGAMMNDVDFVLMGAHCVTEHGGLVHTTGSLQIATVAQAMNVPCYVLCETFKFTQIFPLSTKDLKQPAEGSLVYPLVEFVPPSMITLVFTEQGIMPPSAVADEMFRINTARR